MVVTRSQTRRIRNSTVSKTNELPMDIIMDIISRLPVKSLLRFKSVSKTWYNLIKNPSFIKTHQTRLKQNPNPKFSAILSTLKVKRKRKQIFRVSLIDDLDKPVEFELPLFFDLTKVLGICNGLVCVMLSNESDKSSQIAVCNPLTGEFTKGPIFDKSCDGKENIYYGFCLNGNKGYEFFRMIYEVCRDDKLVLEVGVYSFSTSKWRKINVKEAVFDHPEDNPRPRALYQTMPVFMNGVFYWAATDFDTAYVVSLDVENEIFEEFLAPGDCWDVRWTLCKLNEEVAVVEYNDDELSYYIWILDEKEKSWEKKKLVREGDEVNNFSNGTTVTVLGCAQSGELVVEYSERKTVKLFLYDMYNDAVEDLPYVSFNKNEEVFMYTESLVSVNVGGDQ